MSTPNATNWNRPPGGCCTASSGKYRNPFFDDPSVRGTNRGETNTTTRMHAGILWALKTADPVHSRRARLRRPCHQRNHDRAPRARSTHRRDDLLRQGETTPDIALYIADGDGKITTQEWFQAPYASMVHDFAVTEKWIIFPVMPCVNNLERLRQGGSVYDWEPERGRYLGIMPRDGSAADVRWVHSDARWFYHVMNAYGDGDVIRLDVAETAIQPFPWFHVDPAKAWNQEAANAKLTRWTINPRTGHLGRGKRTRAQYLTSKRCRIVAVPLRCGRGYPMLGAVRS